MVHENIGTPHCRVLGNVIDDDMIVQVIGDTAFDCVEFIAFDFY